MYDKCITMPNKILSSTRRIFSPIRISRCSYTYIRASIRYCNDKLLIRAYNIIQCIFVLIFFTKRIPCVFVRRIYPVHSYAEYNKCINCVPRYYIEHLYYTALPCRTIVADETELNTKITLQRMRT